MSDWNSDNPIDDLPVEVSSAPLGLTHEEGIRATALAMAVRYHGDTIVKDGQMYQQFKLEGKNMQPTAPLLILQIAMDFERYLRGDYAALADQIVGGDFEVWLKRKVDEASKHALQDLEAELARAPEEHEGGVAEMKKETHEHAETHTRGSSAVPPRPPIRDR